MSDPTMVFWLACRWHEFEAWEILGLYKKEMDAVARCDKPLDFVGPLVLNKALSDDAGEWEGAYFPNNLARTALEPPVEKPIEEIIIEPDVELTPEKEKATGESGSFLFGIVSVFKDRLRLIHSQASQGARRVIDRLRPQQ